MRSFNARNVQTQSSFHFGVLCLVVSSVDQCAHLAGEGSPRRRTPQFFSPATRRASKE